MDKDLKSATASIKAIIGNPIQQMFRDIETTAEKYNLEHPDMYNFQRISGAARARWADRFGNQLKNDVRRLAEHTPPKTSRILKAALLERPSTYRQMLNILAPVLMEVGRRLNDGVLVSIARSWVEGDSTLDRYVASLKDDGVDISPKAEKKRSLVGSQNQQADSLVSEVIASLPKQFRHQVRTKVARSENKLLTLQQEMERIGYGSQSASSIEGDES